MSNNDKVKKLFENDGFDPAKVDKTKTRVFGQTVSALDPLVTRARSKVRQQLADLTKTKWKAHDHLLDAVTLSNMMAMKVAQDATSRRDCDHW